MRRSIRNQILVPVLAVQAGAVALLAVTAATMAARRAEAQVVDRLDAVIATLGRSAFPLTPAVLEAMNGLSGAHFARVEPGGRVRDATLAGLPERLPAPGSLPGRVRLDAAGRSASMVVSGARYVVAEVPRAGGSGPASLLVLYPESAWLRARWDAAMPPVAVGLAALVAMGLITALVADRIGRRLRSLEERTAAIAAGDFRPLAPGEPGDEVADLAASINRMCVQLQELRGAIRRTERAGVLAQLAAGLAHSLRNAATGARMAIQLHARRCPSGGDDRSLEVALRQLTLGEEQVRALLAIGRPGPAGRVEEIDPSGIVEDVAALVEATCRHARVDFLPDAAAGARVAADAEALRAAVLNLTLNAIEAAGAGGEVTLRVGIVGGSARFDVTDSGPGPPPHLAETLFDPFVTSKPEGVGLGLAVARQVAVDHGGSLGWAREDGRTRFRLSLPIAARRPEEARSLADVGPS